MKIICLFFIALLSACSNLRHSSTYFETLTMTEQPIIPGTFSVETSDNGFAHFYENFIAENLIIRMQKRGWIYKENNPEYVLKIGFGSDTAQRSFSSIANTMAISSTYDVITNKYVDVSLYKKENLVFKLYIKDNQISASIDISNLVIPIIDQELQTKNAYQKHIYSCNIKSSNDKKNISAECYTDTQKYKAKTLNIMKTKIISNPYE